MTLHPGIVQRVAILICLGVKGQVVGDLTVVIIGGLELGQDGDVIINITETQPILCAAKSKHDRRVLTMQYDGVRLQEPHGIFGLLRTLWHHDLAWVCRHRVRGVMDL